MNRFRSLFIQLIIFSKILEGFIIGAGAQGRVALEILKLQSPRINWFFVDDDSLIHNTLINGVLVIGGFSFLESKEKPIIHIAIGKPDLKQKIAVKCEKLNGSFISAIHPSAIVSSTAKIGIGVLIGACSVINSNSVIKDNVIINTNVIVEHDSFIDENSNISPAAVIGGRVRIQKNVFIGSGAIIRARTIIGSGSIVGMGAVVLNNISSNTLSFGVPAKEVAKIDNNFNWSNVL